jgi:hypothetical protein
MVRAEAGAAGTGAAGTGAAGAGVASKILPGAWAGVGAAWKWCVSATLLPRGDVFSPSLIPSLLSETDKRIQQVSQMQNFVVKIGFQWYSNLTKVAA